MPRRRGADFLESEDSRTFQRHGIRNPYKCGRISGASAGYCNRRPINSENRCDFFWLRNRAAVWIEDSADAARARAADVRRKNAKTILRFIRRFNGSNRADRGNCVSGKDACYASRIERPGNSSNFVLLERG